MPDALRMNASLDIGLASASPASIAAPFASFQREA
jgi:hypothetical protein